MVSRWCRGIAFISDTLSSEICNAFVDDNGWRRGNIKTERLIAHFSSSLFHSFTILSRSIKFISLTI